MLGLIWSALFHTPRQFLAHCIDLARFALDDTQAEPALRRASSTPNPLQERGNHLAFWRRGKPNALLHPSGHGGHCAPEQFRLLLADNGVTCSLSRSGNVLDNAAMECSFPSLKTARTDRKVDRSRAEAKAEVFDHIEGSCNPWRRHSTPGHISPIEFESR